MTDAPYPDGWEIDNTSLTPDGNLGWWVVQGSMPNAIPAMDLRCHVLGAGCWCHPMDDGEVLNHNALDQRERLQAGAKPH